MMMKNIFNLFLFLLVLNYSTQSKAIATTTSRKFLNSTLSSIKTINVVNDFGASHYGKTDATQAFLNAWDAACKSSVTSQIYVPNGEYLLKFITFQGPCKSKIVFSINGTFVAHDSSSEYWIVFHNVDDLQIKGGVLNAKGKEVWECKTSSRRQNCPEGATSLMFVNSRNIRVNDLTSKNSQKFHMSLEACQNINMNNLKINATEDSPNTDGIHLANSQDIIIKNSTIMTGDDCISIGPNTQNIWIEHVFCGPGHGISIGSLGRKSDDGVVVRNITVQSTNFRGTQNGVRIKTFSTPVKGFVKDIYFIGATMINVENPIIIDQNYCPNGECPSGQGSNIEINNVQYKNIQGTSSTKEIVTFDCSPMKPCNELTLQDISLSYESHEANNNTSNCILKNVMFKVAQW